MTKPKLKHAISEVDITPELALDMLTRNQNNRSVSAKHVALLADQMRAGTFHFVGDSIKFDTEGRLLDGQHRLHAIIESETTHPMVVITNLPPESQVYMDAARRRSPGDQLVVALGIKNGNHAAAIARNYLLWKEQILLVQKRTIGIPEIVQWAERHEDQLVQATTCARRVTAAQVPTSVAVSGGVYLAARDRSPADAEVFWERLADGVGLDADNPILVLRNTILRRAKSERWTRVEEWAYYTRAWNVWRRQGSMQRLQGWRDAITLENLRLK